MPSPIPARPHVPCHGPNCSRGHGVPLLPVPTVSSPASPEWGWLAEAPAVVPADRGAVLSDCPSPSPIHFESSIFHPPRLAA
jgi:hypothetical protein